MKIKIFGISLPVLILATPTVFAGTFYCPEPDQLQYDQEAESWYAELTPGMLKDWGSLKALGSHNVSPKDREQYGLIFSGTILLVNKAGSFRSFACAYEAKTERSKAITLAPDPDYTSGLRLALEVKEFPFIQSGPYWEAVQEYFFFSSCQKI